VAQQITRLNKKIAGSNPAGSDHFFPILLVGFPNWMSCEMDPQSKEHFFLIILNNKMPRYWPRPRPRYCLPLYGSMRLNEIDLKSLGPCRVQVQINNALRLALKSSNLDNFEHIH
jgi:hypothetical protein